MQQGVGIDNRMEYQVSVCHLVTFPKIISMMPGGALFGVLFFASLVLAGITLLISLVQVVAAASFRR